MLPPMSRDVYIVNPRAGRGRSTRFVAELAARLAPHGLEGDILTTNAPGEATALAAQAIRSGARRIIAVGGDGTAHEVVNGVAGSDAVFGLLPLGTGNDTALAMGIPSDPEPALAVLAAGHESRIDLGRFDERWFVNSLGLGFEAQVTIESTRIRGLRGFSVYLAAVVRALAGLRCPELVIRVDGREIAGPRLLVSIGNGPRVGGGFLLTPDAVNSDGVLDVCIVDGMNRLRVLRTLPRAISGTHVTAPGVSMTRGRIVEFSSPDGFPFHADGEVIDVDRNELRVEIVPGALRVCVPAPERSSR
ncbi:diacylglycerol kinase family lipid kinase [bacterium]|nr:diacylglycerol kinase family lipid kinase [bacterium]